MDTEIPMDLLELRDMVSEVVDNSVKWSKCNIKVMLTNSFYMGELEKEKSSIDIKYIIPSDHPRARDSEYSVSFKISRDRTIEFKFKGLYLDPCFAFNVTGSLFESQISDIPNLIGDYLDIGGSDNVVHPIVEEKLFPDAG